MPKALIVEILGDAKQFAGELDRAAGKTRRFGAAAGVAGLAIAGGLALGLDKSVKAAKEMQVSTAKMDTAFEASGLNAKQFAGQIDQAESSSRNLGFSNIDVRDSLGSLVTATHSGSAAIKDLSVAEDLARFKHIGLGDASKILTSAMAGSTRAARQLGLSVAASKDASTQASIAYQHEKTAIDNKFGSTSKMTAAEKAAKQAALDNLTTKYQSIKADAALQDKQTTSAKVIELVSTKLHGQADAYAHTAEGGAAVMHAQVEALEENLGSALLPALGEVTKALATATGFLAQHGDVAKLVIAGLAVLAATLIGISIATKLYAAGQAIASAATGVWTAAQWLLNAALDANPIGLVVIAIAALVGAFIVAWKTSGTFRDIVTGVWDDVKSGAEAFASFFTTTIPNAFQAVKDWVSSHWPEIVTLLSGPFAPLVAIATDGFGVRSALLGAFRDVKSWFSDKWGDVSGLISGAFTSIEHAAENGFGVPDAISGGFKAVRGWFHDTWTDVKGFITAPFDDLVSGASNAFGLKGALSGAWSDIKSATKDAFAGFGAAVAAVFKAPINAIIDAIDAIKLPVGIHIKTWHGIPDGFSIDWGTPFNIPQLAAGGIVRQPTLAMIGEAGPEAVVPLNSAGASPIAGGSSELHVHFEGPVFGDKRAVANELATAIRDELVRIGMREPTILSRKGVTV